MERFGLADRDTGIGPCRLRQLSDFTRPPIALSASQTSFDEANPRIAMLKIHVLGHQVFEFDRCEIAELRNCGI